MLSFKNPAIWYPFALLSKLSQLKLSGNRYRKE